MKTQPSNNSSNAAEFHTEKDDIFGRIASRYDLLCDLFSFGIHRIWKRRIAKRIAEDSWSDFLDAASGTGEIVLRVLNKSKLQPNQNIIVSDICTKMLSMAEKRLERFKSNLDFEILDIHSMPSIKSESIDLYSMSLGLKICNRQKALTEAFRVLKPGGRLIILEASNIPVSWLHHLYITYMSLCMPFIGWIATKGDASAYKYLLQGVKDFPCAEELRKEIYSYGYEDVSFERLSFGIVAIHIAHKPADSNV